MRSSPPSHMAYDQHVIVPRYCKNTHIHKFKFYISSLRLLEHLADNFKLPFWLKFISRFLIFLPSLVLWVSVSVLPWLRGVMPELQGPPCTLSVCTTARCTGMGRNVEACSMHEAVSMCLCMHMAKPCMRDMEHWFR